MGKGKATTMQISGWDGDGGQKSWRLRERFLERRIAGKQKWLLGSISYEGFLVPGKPESELVVVPKH